MKLLTSFVAGLAIGMWIACYGGLPCPAGQAAPGAGQTADAAHRAFPAAALVLPEAQPERWPVRSCLRMARTEEWRTAASMRTQVAQSLASFFPGAAQPAPVSASFRAAFSNRPHFFPDHPEEVASPCPARHETGQAQAATQGLSAGPGAAARSPERAVRTAAQRPAAPSPARSVASPIRPESIYDRGLEAYRQGRYEAARNDFAGFLASFPNHALHPNALYWSGECWYAQGQYERARQAFAHVVQLHPGHAKSSDALLKEAYCLARQGQTGEALRRLDMLDRQYPASHAARLGAEVRGQWQRGGGRHG